MANRTVNCTPEVVTLTENTSTVFIATRNVVCTSAAIALTERRATINDEFFASIAQTLPSVTQAATGVTGFFSVAGRMTIDNVVALSYTHTETHSLTMSEVILYSEDRAYTDAATISESVSYLSKIPYTDTFYASSSVSGIEWTTSLSPVALVASNRVEYNVTIPLASSMTIAETPAISITTSKTR